MSKKKSPPPAPQLSALPSGGVDTHAHLDAEQFDADRDEVIARAHECGVSYIGNVFLCPQEYASRKHYFALHPKVFFLLGIHPSDAQICDDHCIDMMQQFFIQDPRLKAVGEIGLDFYWDSCPKDIQMHTFVRQLRMAKALQRPVVIHSRDATDPTLALLEREGFKDYPLLWHCFGGTVAEAKRIIYNGWYISIPGTVSFPKNTEVRDALRVIPLERLVLETDCPYLAPQEWRGKRNEPALTVFTAHCIAQTLNIDAPTLWQRCGANAQRFFSL